MSPLAFTLEPFRAMCDYVAGHMHCRDLALKGDGHPVLIFPGLTLDGSSTADMRVRLRQLGYSVYDWQQGFNYGPETDFDRWLKLLSDQVVEIHARHQRPVSLIGCSLGGIYARELAKLNPGIVRQVITLATPFLKCGTSADESTSIEFLGNSFLTNGPLLRRLNENPNVPCSSIFSQSDGILNWKSCMKEETPLFRNIEVVGVSHLGMPHHPDVFNVVCLLLQKVHAKFD